MSPKKQWTGREKLAIVLEELKGECRISELCNEHGISQGMYYKWRAQLLTDGYSAMMLVGARLRHISTTKWGTRQYMSICKLYESGIR